MELFSWVDVEMCPIPIDITFSLKLHNFALNDMYMTCNFNNFIYYGAIVLRGLDRMYKVCQTLHAHFHLHIFYIDATCFQMHLCSLWYNRQQKPIWLYLRVYSTDKK